MDMTRGDFDCCAKPDIPGPDPAKGECGCCDRASDDTGFIRGSCGTCGHSYGSHFGHRFDAAGNLRGADRPVSYYLDHDGNGDLTLWNGHPTHPEPVAARHDVGDDAWSLLLLGAGLHKQAAPEPTEDEDRLGYHQDYPGKLFWDDQHDTPATDNRTTVLGEIHAERARQDQVWGQQNHPDTHPVDRDAHTAQASDWKQINDLRIKHNALAWDGILLEEVYEALAEVDPARIRAELLQVAAVAAAWMQAIDRRACDDSDRCPSAEHYEGCFADWIDQGAEGAQEASE